MAGTFLSADWYRVAALRPRIRRQVDFHRQIFRGRVWFVVQDHQSGSFNRLTAQGHYLFGRMNGMHSIQSLWEDACSRFPDDPPTQSDTIHLLSQLYQADLISSDIVPDMTELAKRARKKARQRIMTKFSNPMALRLPLLDPDHFLSRTQKLVAPLFTRIAAGLWLALMAFAVWLTVVNWQELSQSALDHALVASNVALIALTYPIVKLLHELGHAYATKHWGGEVREVGILVLLFVPVPYVDASQATAFTSKWQRAAVGAAGIVVELTLAALALLFWLNAEPGLARAFAFDVMLIGGISTLIFNGNPLLRFDGYFILSDLLEIPNLSQHANRYFWYLCQRYLLSVRDIANPAKSRSEQAWLIAYAVTSFLYRQAVTLAIAVFIAGKFLMFGLILAIFVVFTALVMPVLKGSRFLLNSPSLSRGRGRAFAVTASFVGAITFLLFVMPMPYVTVVQGVLWPDSHSILRSEAEGFVSKVLIASGQQVKAGTPILVLDDPSLLPRIDVAASSVRQLELELAAARLIDKVQAKMLDQQLIYARKQLLDLREDAANLIVRSALNGAIHLPNEADLIGHLIRKGEAIGYVWPGAQPKLRVAVDQGQAELVRTRTQKVDFVLQRDIKDSYAARITARVPESTLDLPSKALTTEGGGEIVANPDDPKGLTAFQSMYLFEITPVHPIVNPMIGERAIVRFNHGAEPYGFRVLRNLRQIFLRRLGQ